MKRLTDIVKVVLIQNSLMCVLASAALTQVRLFSIPSEVSAAAAAATGWQDDGTVVRLVTLTDGLQLPMHGTNNPGRGEIFIDTLITSHNAKIVFGDEGGLDSYIISLPTGNLIAVDGAIISYSALNDEFDMVSALPTLSISGVAAQNMTINSGKVDYDFLVMSDTDTLIWGDAGINKVTIEGGLKLFSSVADLELRASTPAIIFTDFEAATTGKLKYQAEQDMLTVEGMRLALNSANVTLSAGATSFTPTANLITLTGDSGGNTLAQISGSNSGITLMLLFVDGLITVTDDNGHGANTIDLSAAFTSADDTILTLVNDGTSWYEVSRSVN